MIKGPNVLINYTYICDFCGKNNLKEKKAQWNLNQNNLIQSFSTCLCVYTFNNNS